MNEGQQPCNDFSAQRDDYYDMDNRHDCYAKGCKGKVSLCENCFKDHHLGGYETCTNDWKHVRKG